MPTAVANSGDVNYEEHQLSQNIFMQDIAIIPNDSTTAPTPVDLTLNGVFLRLRTNGDLAFYGSSTWNITNKQNILADANAFATSADATNLVTAKAYADSQVQSYLSGSTFGGSVVPTSNPAPTTNHWYLATAPGTYTNMGGFVIGSNIFAIFSFVTPGNTWSVSTSTFTISDGSITTAKLAPAAVTTDRINDKAVTAIKADFLSQTKNLYNKNYTAGDGFFVVETTGNLSANATYSASDFIPVTGSTAYMVSGNAGTLFRHAWYDINKVYISGLNATFPQTSPATAKYLRVTVNQVSKATVQVEQDSAATLYVAYGFTLDDSKVDLPSYRKTSVLIKESDTNFFTKTKNLYDSRYATDGFFVNWTSPGQIVANPSYSASDYIPVSPNLPYFLSGNGGILYMSWYDINKLWISGNNTGTFPLTSPSNAAYARITTLVGSKSTTQFEQSSAATGYVLPYSFHYGSGSGGVNNWAGLKVAQLGDSTSAYNSWQPSVITALGILSLNLGVAGTKVSGGDNTGNSFWSDARLSLIASDTKCLLILGGINDWANNVALGAVDSSDTNTFYGAFNTLMGKLMSTTGSYAFMAAARIMLMTTTYAEFIDYASRGFPNGYTNTIGLTTNDYAAAIRTVGLRWNVPVIDTNARCGWNHSNITDYISNDGALLHFNTIGGKRVAEVVIGSMKSLDPISLI